MSQLVDTGGRVGLSQEEAESLLADLCREPRETTWLEFKENYAEPQDIGEYVSALANAAVLAGRGHAYMVWGVRDGDHQIVGTSFSPEAHKVGNEDFVPWLIRGLDPQVTLSFTEIPVGDSRVCLLEVSAARERPIAFKGREFIRVGSYKKPLRDYPDSERRLWRAFEREAFETGVARDRVREDEVLQLLDYPSYFQLLQKPLPESRRGVLEQLEADKLILRAQVGWAITNLGAVLFARSLSDFDSVARKYVRVIQYRGSSRVETIREQEGGKGYASGFEGLIAFVNGVLPRNEIIGQALRTEEALYPELAIRELVPTCSSTRTSR
jgi:predicted HTH transcriptional regulator